MSFITWMLCQTVFKALINQYYIHCSPLVHTVILSQRAIRLVEPGLCMVNPCWLFWHLKPEVIRPDTSFRLSIKVALRDSQESLPNLKENFWKTHFSSPKHWGTSRFCLCSPYPMWVSMEQIKIFCLSEASSIVCVAHNKHHWMKPFKLLKRL